jgi:hypothetical protein
VITVAAVSSVVFNFVLLFIWRYEFGRNPLAPTASSQTWAEPLQLLAEKNGNGNGNGGVHDRDLVLALTPQKVEALAERFDRVRQIVGTSKKPRFNALLSLTTEDPSGVQGIVEGVLEKQAKRWKLDEVVTAEGKPCELAYLVKIRKSMSSDELLTEVRTAAGDKLISADLELSEAMEREAEAAQSGAG